MAAISPKAINSEGSNYLNLKSTINDHQLTHLNQAWHKHEEEISDSKKPYVEPLQ
jgi:hypothetical protein